MSHDSSVASSKASAAIAAAVIPLTYRTTGNSPPAVCSAPLCIIISRQLSKGVGTGVRRASMQWWKNWSGSPTWAKRRSHDAGSIFRAHPTTTSGNTSRPRRKSTTLVRVVALAAVPKLSLRRRFFSALTRSSSSCALLSADKKVRVACGVCACVLLLRACVALRAG